ncbi:MAG TPA: hypothetical protein DCL77_13485 [Prolixibacteraceae bacterium]|nr:hypothetical protein [Prolixibacteraceae bacterium]
MGEQTEFRNQPISAPKTSYRKSMKTPFSVEQFFHVFEQYNLEIFPGQIVIALLGILGLVLLQVKAPIKDRYIGVFLGLLWIWTGLIYHIAFFSIINEAAYLFGDLFILQGILFLYNSFKGRLHFSIEPDIADYIGYFFILFGLVIYPLIGLISKGSITGIISLGLPCPSVIFTFGFLILTKDHLPKYLLIIPSVWALIGISAAVNFGVYQDLMILISAIFAIVFLGFRKKATKKI